MADGQAGAVWLTTAEVAERLKVSVPTVKRWRREGIGPLWHRAGRQIRYRPAEVDRWVEEDGRQ